MQTKREKKIFISFNLFVWIKGLDQIYEGIRKNAEINAQRAKSDPEFAKQQEARAQADYYGHYVPSK